MRPTKTGDMRTVANLESDHNLLFVSDFQDVQAVRDQVENAKGYNAFFVKIGQGEYIEVWGMMGIAPYQSKLVSRLL